MNTKKVNTNFIRQFTLTGKVVSKKTFCGRWSQYLLRSQLSDLKVHILVVVLELYMSLFYI